MAIVIGTVVDLEVVDETDIALPWFHFISVLTFATTNPASDALLLRSLVMHARYRNAYAGGVGAEEGLHGPYLIEKLPTDPYVRSGPETAYLTLLGWIYRHTYSLAELPDDVDVNALLAWLGSVAGTTLETAPIAAADPSNTFDPQLPAILDMYLLAPLKQARAVYQLPELPDSLGPDWSVFNANGFHEFVAIDESGMTMNLIVATDD